MTERKHDLKIERLQDYTTLRLKDFRTDRLKKNIINENREYARKNVEE